MKDLNEPSPNLEPHTVEIINLFNQGKTPVEISNITGRPISTVRPAIARARDRGEVHHQYVMAGIYKDEIRSAAKRLGTKIGVLGTALAKETSPEVQKELLILSKKQGYESLAHLAVDLLTEHYFENKEQSDD